MNAKIKYLAFLTTILATFTGCGSDNNEPGDNNEQQDINIPVKATVTDYVPAPGQFINELPEAEPGDSYATVLKRADESISDGEPVSLGAFGGYIILKTDTPLTGRFRVIGNAIPNGSEPGIVSISADGKEWFDIAGEKFETAKEITITYNRPTADATDNDYISYTCSDGTKGFISRLPAFHTQPYYPVWINENSISFTAKMLPNNSELVGEDYKFTPLWGYADSYPNKDEKSIIDPTNAIDKNGNKVNLKSFSYIKVTSAILRVNGRLGESSTEVAGIERIVKQ